MIASGHGCVTCLPWVGLGCETLAHRVATLDFVLVSLVGQEVGDEEGFLNDEGRKESPAEIREGRCELQGTIVVIDVSTILRNICQIDDVPDGRCQAEDKEDDEEEVVSHEAELLLVLEAHEDKVEDGECRVDNTSEEISWELALSDDEHDHCRDACELHQGSHESVLPHFEGELLIWLEFLERWLLGRIVLGRLIVDWLLHL